MDIRESEVPPSCKSLCVLYCTTGSGLATGNKRLSTQVNLDRGPDNSRLGGGWEGVKESVKGEAIGTFRERKEILEAGKPFM